MLCRRSMIQIACQIIHGFDTFYGYLDHAAAQDYFYDYMWQTQTGAPNGVATVVNNGGPGGTPQYTHDLFAAKSEQYITAHAADSHPFYMQVNYTIPHLRHRPNLERTRRTGHLCRPCLFVVDDRAKGIRRDDHAHGRQRRLADGEAREPGRQPEHQRQHSQQHARDLYVGQRREHGGQRAARFLYGQRPLSRRQVSRFTKAAFTCRKSPIGTARSRRVP